MERIRQVLTLRLRLFGRSLKSGHLWPPRLRSFKFCHGMRPSYAAWNLGAPSAWSRERGDFSKSGCAFFLRHAAFKLTFREEQYVCPNMSLARRERGDLCDCDLRFLRAQGESQRFGE